ncbi:MAG: hypothetical protein HY511_05655, partial [Actinobacteria bacterium]|nr:hypothetical protein [Actinomycetota bacterium]
VASAAPASAALFLELNADLDSAQWQEVKGLADDVKAGKGLFKDLAKQATGVSADWAQVDAAFGPVVALVVLEDGDNAVALTHPDDDAKLKALVGDKAVTREVGGWTAVSEKAAALDAYEAALAKGSLAGDAAFAKAMEGLPAETLVRLYTGGAGLGKAFAAAAGQAGAGGTSGGLLGGLSFDPSALAGLGGAEGVKSLTAAVEAVDGALRVTGALESGKSVGSTYTPAFLKKIPAGVIAAADWHGSKDLLSSLRSNASLSETVAQLETALGVTLDQLDPLVAGEGALYVRPGIALPEVTVVLEVADEAAALAILDGIVQRLAGLAEGKTSETTVDGVTAKVLDLGLFKLTYAAVDGTLIATTAATGIADFRSETGDKLADDPAFAAAAEQAGLGETTSGFVFADVPKVVQLLNGLGGALGGLLGGESGSTGGGDQLVPIEGIERFGTLFAHATADGTTVRFAGVLTIK